MRITASNSAKLASLNSAILLQSKASFRKITLYIKAQTVAKFSGSSSKYAISRGVLLLFVFLLCAPSCAAKEIKPVVPVAVQNSGKTEKKPSDKDINRKTNIDKTQQKIALPVRENTKDNKDIKDVTSSEKLTEEAITQDVDFSKIGCVLPLSGKAKLVGKTVLNGIMLGLKEINEKRTEPISIVVRNSKASPDKVARIVEELAADEHVSAIIGPVDASVSRAAAKAADEFEIPIITLAVKNDISMLSDFVFREAGVLENELKKLVQVIVDKGFSHPGIMYPGGAYGIKMLETVEKILKIQNLELAGKVSYTPGSKDFIDEAKEAALWDIDSLILLPISSDFLALAAPALVKAGLWPLSAKKAPKKSKPVLYLTIQSGLGINLIKRAGRYLEGLIVSCYFHALLPGKFGKNYKMEYKVAPNYLGAYGHDAIHLLARAIEKNPASRTQLKEYLADLNVGDFDYNNELATSFNGFDENGEPLAAPVLIQIKDNFFKILE